MWFGDGVVSNSNLPLGMLVFGKSGWLVVLFLPWGVSGESSPRFLQISAPASLRHMHVLRLHGQISAIPPTRRAYRRVHQRQSLSCRFSMLQTTSAVSISSGISSGGSFGGGLVGMSLLFQRMHFSLVGQWSVAPYLQVEASEKSAGGSTLSGAVARQSVHLPVCLSTGFASARIYRIFPVAGWNWFGG